MELPSPTPDLIICGDLILPHADWENRKCQPGATKDEQQMVQELHTLTTEKFMVQYVDEPTHRNGNTLDLLFSNNSDLVHSFTSAHSLLSDHLMIEFKAVYKPNTSHLEEKEAKNQKWSPEAKSTIISQFQLLQWRIQLGIHQPRIQQLQLVARLQRMYPRCYDEKILCYLSSNCTWLCPTKKQSTVLEQQNSKTQTHSYEDQVPHQYSAFKSSTRRKTSSSQETTDGNRKEAPVLLLLTDSSSREEGCG